MRLLNTITVALRDFNLTVNEGEFVAVTGPSGSGKTTFLTIAGLLEAFSAGTYKLDGIDVSRMGDAERSRIRNQKIGFIFQAFNLIPDLNVLDNIEVPLRYRGMSGAERKKRAADALARVGLSARARHYPAELSGGQQQRVAIARALINDPQILLADEPTGNLDSKTSVEIMGVFQKLNEQGITIIMVTHELDIAHYCKRNLIMRDGRLVSDTAVAHRLVATEELRKLQEAEAAAKLTA